MSDVRSLLVIRRDNIGDLVCTTPLIAALRAAYPQAWLGVLANSYNAPVLEGSPDIDAVHAYHKLKHIDRAQGTFSILSALAGRLRMLRGLRAKNLDLVVLAGAEGDLSGEKTARRLAPARIVRSAPAVPGQHEVERTFSAARILGIEGAIPPLRVTPRAAARTRVLDALARAGLADRHPLLGIHISARRPAQRWPAGHFAGFIAAARKKYGAATLLFWSPGPADHAQHPGDDAKAQTILGAAGGAALLPYPTTALADLIGALAVCDAVLCSDGGAMHLAAGLGKPIACFFGDSPVERWRPWGVQHAILQPPTRRVEDVRIEDALTGLEKILPGVNPLL